jgi:hypothetical protein
MPRVPAHLCDLAFGMLQGDMRTADVARAINCNVCTMRRLRWRYRKTGQTADRPCSGRPCVITAAQDRYNRMNKCYNEPRTLERDRFGGGESLVVWGGVSQHHRTELVVIAGNLNAVTPLCSGTHYSTSVSHMSVELVQFMSQLLNLVMFIQIFTHVKFVENKRS